MTQQELKKAKESWRKHSEEVQNATYSIPETPSERMKRIAHLRCDYAAFVAYYFPHWTTDKETGKNIPCAKFHTQAANYIKDSRRMVSVFQWARGHAKSTHMGVFIPLWLKCQEKKDIHVFVLVGKSEDSAQTLLGDIQSELQYNGRYIADFGNQYNAGSWETGKFATLDGCAFFARGRGQSPRGLRYRDQRPDYIVIDDLDDDELCLSEQRVNKMTDWVKEALFGTFGAEGGRFIMVGNLISKNSVLANVSKLDGTHVSKVNVRDKNGLPAWGEYWTEERIKVRESMGYRAFQKEYMNNPITEGEVFTELRYEKIPALKRFRFLVCYGDPSPSNNKNKSNSMKAVWLIGFLEGKYYVIDGRVNRGTNAEFVDWFYDINQSVPDGVQVYNLIENNTLQDPFYQQVFIPMFVERAKAGKAINITPDERKKPDKFSRIEGNLEPLNTQGRLIFNAEKRENADFKRLEEQFLLLTPQLKAPADGADCIEGGVWIINQKMAQLLPDTFSFGTRRNNSKRY
ncbi:hypothetical protein FACS1894162_3590 [Bacteroidia bacterium]|nr:hypothetical protein FACS1894162_3590 [Bacteroidia bacterium]